VNRKIRLAAFFLVALVVAACSTKAHHDVIVRPNVWPSKADLQRVAIVPNRIPLMTEDPDFWRRGNWERVAERFRSNGIAVADYSTSVSAFGATGAQFGDQTDYAALAARLSVDAIVVPYYGVYSSFSLWLLLGRARYNAVTTFDIYLAKENDFIARIEATARNQYAFGGLTAIGVIVTAAGAYAVGIPILAVGAAIDLYQATVPEDARWGEAFDQAIEEGLGSFFANLSEGPASIASSGIIPAATIDEVGSRFDDGAITLSLDLTLQNLQGSMCCAVALFSDKEGNPLPATRTYGIQGQLAVAGDFVPRSSPEHRRLTLSLPPGELGLEGMKDLGRHEYLTRIEVWKTACGSPRAGLKPLRISQPVPVCVRKLAAGYIGC